MSKVDGTTTSDGKVEEPCPDLFRPTAAAAAATSMEVVLRHHHQQQQWA
jgi:hypothetical protein